MTNNKQQTAVDILCGKLAMKLGIPQAITFYIDHQEEIREAKEMEKKRMIEFAQSYAVIHCMGDITKNAEEYYDETYGDGK